MSGFSDLAAFAVPVALAAAWTGLLVTRRRVGWPFFAAAFGSALLCFPGGIIAGRIDRPGTSCPADDPQFCLSPHMGTLWINGFLGLCCCVLLLVITLIIKLLRVIGRR